MYYILGRNSWDSVNRQNLSGTPVLETLPTYFWMIDDLSVIQRPAYDLQMKSAWLTMENPPNIEYYSIPENQMPEEMLIGAEVYNYGYNDDGVVTLTGTINSTSAGGTIEYELVESDSTEWIETDYFDVSMLTVGTYSFTADIASSGDMQL